jgi:threonine synthase
VFDLGRARRGARSRDLWAKLDSRGEFDLSAVALAHRRLPDFVSGMSTHRDRLATIPQRSRALRRDRSIRTPLTESRLSGRYREPGVPMICLRTALPAKFAETIREALGARAGAAEGAARTWKRCRSASK